MDYCQDSLAFAEGLQRAVVDFRGIRATSHIASVANPRLISWPMQGSCHRTARELRSRLIASESEEIATAHKSAFLLLLFAADFLLPPRLRLHRLCFRRPRERQQK